MKPLPIEGRQRGDRWPVALAASIAVSAWVAATGSPAWVPEVPEVPLGIALAGALTALASRRPVLICLAAAVLTTCLTQRSLAGLTGIETPQPVQAEVTLVSDPRPTLGSGVQADVRLDGKRLALRAHRSPAAALRDRLAGERVIVVGKVQPPTAYEEFLRHRHLAGRLQVDTVVGWQPGHAVTRAANGLRRTLAAGAESLPERHQSLLAGLLLGDSREHPADLTEAFRRSGLAHLLAVSGDNVAVLMVILAPLLSRLRMAPRLVVMLVVLAGFALVTRGEPSVVRATVMAAVGAYAAAAGQPVSNLRRLSFAVTGLLLVDPLLVTALGFRLSVAGTAGIIVGARPIAHRLPGPRWLRLATAMTVAAELAVAPLVVATFGSVPLVSLPANLLAAMVAGPVKVWGLSAGLVAGLAGEPVATVLHLPTAAMLTWLDGVATFFADLPVGELATGHLVALAAAGAALVAGRRIDRLTPSLALRLAGSVVAVVTLVVASLSVAGESVAEDGLVEIGPGVDLWRGGGAAVAIIDGRATEEWLESGLQREQVDRLDALILRTPANRAVSVAGTLVERWPEMAVLAPAEVAQSPGARIKGAATPVPGAVLQVGTLRMAFDVEPDRLEPDVTLMDSAGVGGGRSAP